MRWGFGALMINQFKGTTIDLCGDVTEPTPISGLLDLAANLNDLQSVPQGGLNVDNIVCGMLQIPTKTSTEIFEETCPGLTAVVGDPPNVQLLNTSFGCKEPILELLPSGKQLLGSAKVHFLRQVVVHRHPDRHLPRLLQLLLAHVEDIHQARQEISGAPLPSFSPKGSLFCNHQK